MGTLTPAALWRTYGDSAGSCPSRGQPSIWMGGTGKTTVFLSLLNGNWQTATEQLGRPCACIRVGKKGQFCL